MAKFTPIDIPGETNCSNRRSNQTVSPRRTAAEMEVSRLRSELHEKEVKIDNQKWQLDCEARRNRILEDQIRQLNFELRSARSSSQSSGSSTLDLGLWRRILKLVHADYHKNNADEANEVTKLIIAMKPNR